MSCFLLSFVDCVENEYPEKEKTIYERAVTWWHTCRYLLFATALRSGMLQRSLEFHSQHRGLIRGLRNPFPNPVRNPTAFTQDEEALFCGAGTTDVMCQAVVSHCILALFLSYVWVNRFRIWKLPYIATCSNYFPSKNQIYLFVSFFSIEVNQIGSTFHLCEPNRAPHW